MAFQVGVLPQRAAAEKGGAGGLVKNEELFAGDDGPEFPSGGHAGQETAGFHPDAPSGAGGAKPWMSLKDRHTGISAVPELEGEAAEGGVHRGMSVLQIYGRGITCHRVFPPGSGPGTR